MIPRPASALLPLPPSRAALLGAVLLASCAGGGFKFPGRPQEDSVIYALGPREGYKSPLTHDLKTACPALVFGSEGFALTPEHEHAIRVVFEEFKDSKKGRLLIAGYSSPDLPQDHARALSERRAQAVRQRLIELGMEPAHLQTVGFGNDFAPMGPSSGVVVVYRQN